MSTSVIQIRVDENLKMKATEIYSDLGIDISTAIRMFLKRSVLENGIPFSMTLPQKPQEIGLKALAEINEQAKKVGVSDMTLEEINAEIAKTRQSR